MKGFKLFLSVLVMLPVVCTAAVFAAPEQKRTSIRRQADVAQQNTKKTNAVIRTTNPRTVGTSTTQTRGNTKSQNVVARPQTTIARNVSNSIRPVTGNVQSRSTITTQPRVISSRKNTNKTRATVSRNTTSTSATSILSRDYSKCRDVFNTCMDEFCANKDTQLKRCACSTRYSEFKNSKANLDAVEDKLLDFSQRLLTVNMDKEDALAINQATEGELAYDTKDTSESKKILDQISKKLNTTFDDDNFGMNTVSYSLNIDSAFDNIDSLTGASTTTKIGTALYTAALPVCRKMAAEVCSDDEIKIAESSYQLVIEQDCNTVAKTYQAQTDQARAKVLESEALLDMSRLDIHQKRNSDDMLTCKTKMLNMLTDSTVCGEKLYKCLDTTGHFINPATGNAILTTDLHLLQNAIVRPTGDLTWKQIPGNAKYVTFLNSKKDYLKPAMENCQNIADTVWDGFLDDALAQIKLAQNEKLEEVRQSCITLTAECINEENDTIADFDARALSVFGIIADKTANEMCSNVLESCGALLDNLGSPEWKEGASEIMTTKTYETVLQTCRVVGENCIVQNCYALNGNFALCKDSETINRGSLFTKRSCWKEVEDCIASAGDDALKRIQQLHPFNDIPSFYNSMYATVPSPLYDFCDECDPTDLDCYKCRMTERIWGNCMYNPIDFNTQNANEIIYDGADTLLAWLGRNTGDYSCAAKNAMLCEDKFNVTKMLENCCEQKLVKFQNLEICCETNGQTSSANNNYYGDTMTVNANTSICIPTNSTGTTAKLLYVNDDVHIYCVGNLEKKEEKTKLDDNSHYMQEIICDGRLLYIKPDGTFQTLSGNTWSEAETYYYDQSGSSVPVGNDNIGFFLDYK